jgi:hypothetical protein
VDSPRGKEVVDADGGDQGLAKRPEMKRKKAAFRDVMRPGKRRALPDAHEGSLLNPIETAKVHIRIKAEHPAGVIRNP